MQRNVPRTWETLLVPGSNRMASYGLGTRLFKTVNTNLHKYWAADSYYFGRLVRSE